MTLKLGPHILSPTPNGRLWARNTGIVKEAFGLSVLQQASPGILTVSRPLWMLNPDGAQAAQDVLNFLGGYRPSYVELWNEGDEWGQKLGWGLEERVAQTEIATAILHDNGVRVATVTSSTGVPDQAEWLYWQDHNFGGGDAVALHEYWGNEGFSTWNALRYRRVHDWLGGNHPPFVITECGRGEVEGGLGGWKRDGLSQNQYVTELLAYQAEIAQDPYLLGATVFSLQEHLDPLWEPFNVDELVPLLLGIKPPGGSILLVLAGAVMAAVAVGLVAAQVTGVEAEVAVTIPGRPPARYQVFPNVMEIDEGAPIPPGYVRVG